VLPKQTRALDDYSAHLKAVKPAPDLSRFGVSRANAISYLINRLWPVLQSSDNPRVHKVVAHFAVMRINNPRIVHALLQMTAIRPLLVRLVPASTIRPLRANSPRRGRTVLGFMESSLAISSSVLGVRHRNS
jgi:hypothetical protein